MVQLLLTYGADVNVQDQVCVCALALLTMLQFAHSYLPLQNGKSLLMQASECSILTLLLEHEAPLNLQDKVSANQQYFVANDNRAI